MDLLQYYNETYYRGYLPIDSESKKPLCKSYKDAIQDPIEDWAGCCGLLKEDIVLVDFDNEEQGKWFLNMVYNMEIICRIIKTDRGYHFLFQNGGKVKKNYIKTETEGLPQGYKVDIIVNGIEHLKRYGEFREIIMDVKTPDVIPDCLLPVKIETKSRPPAKVKLDTSTVKGTAEYRWLKPVEKGNRRNILFTLGCSMQGKNFVDERIIKNLTWINEYRCKPPLPVKELYGIIYGVLKYEKGKGNVNVEPEVDKIKSMVEKDGFSVIDKNELFVNLKNKTKGKAINKLKLELGKIGIACTRISRRLVKYHTP